MRLKPVTRALGERLARDLPVTGPGQMPLLRSGTTLTASFVTRLLDHGIHAVWIDDAASAGIEPAELLPEEVRTEAAGKVHHALTSARTAFSRSQPLAPEVMTDLGGVVDALASSIADSPDAALAIVDLASADQYTHRHSVNVTALGLLLGRTLLRSSGWTDSSGRQRFDRIEERLLKLGMGLLLHDIGKMAVPSDILNKRGQLSPEEWELMRTHPDAGVALLPPGAISSLALGVVRDHHERWDGSGYPRGKLGPEVSQLARIGAVADVYDAASSERPYKAAVPIPQSVGIITNGAGTQFDPEVVSVFSRVVFPYPVGTEVEVAGRVAVVAENHPHRPHVPTLRFADEAGEGEHRVDLALTPAAAV